VQDGVVGASFRAYFTGGRDIGDGRTPPDAEAGAGLGRGRAQAEPDGCDGPATIRAGEGEARRPGVRACRPSS
jgi:hypothetical protein